MKYWMEKWNLGASSPSVAPFLGDSEGEGPSFGHMFLQNRRMQGPSWHNLLSQYGMMEVRGCAKRDRPVKSDGCVRLRGQKIKGIAGLGASILLHAMWNLKVLWKSSIWSTVTIPPSKSRFTGQEKLEPVSVSFQKGFLSNFHIQNPIMQ